VDDLRQRVAAGFVGAVVALKWAASGPIQFFEVLDCREGYLALRSPWDPCSTYQACRETHVSEPYLIRFAEIPPARRVY